MIIKAKKPGPAVDPKITLEDYAQQWLEAVKAEMDSRTHRGGAGWHQSWHQHRH